MTGGGNRNRRTVLACALLALSTACASQWTMRADRPREVLQWPFEPNRAKVTYERSLTGFDQHRGGSSAWHTFVYGKEKGEQAAFVLPVAVASGSDGRIAVADMGRKCVHLYLPAAGRYLRLQGPPQTPIVSPVGVAFDAALRLYLSDSAGQVLAFGPEGEFLFRLATAGKEPLQRPTGIVCSPRRNRLYVVDTLAHRIDAFTTEGEFVTSFGGRGDGPGQFNFPTHISWAPPGELYVTNALDYRIDILDEDGKPLGSFGHHGDGSGDLAMPKGVAVDRDGVVYVADGLFDNVQLFDRAGQFLLTVGRRGTELGEFWLPAGLFISEGGELYVCDSYNRRIQVFRITAPYQESGS
jgi:DNA-binding beta-propeller fold protein YncE